MTVHGACSTEEHWLCREMRPPWECRKSLLGKLCLHKISEADQVFASCTAAGIAWGGMRHKQPEQGQEAGAQQEGSPGLCAKRRHLPFEPWRPGGKVARAGVRQQDCSGVRPSTFVEIQDQ